MEPSTAGGSKVLIEMKQLLQNVGSGVLTIEDVPSPERDGQSLLVATSFSLISAGTERAVLEMGQASLIGKARARPELAHQVLDSARAEGIGSTYAKVRGRLAEPNALGYSSSGVVIEACADAPAAPSELVACAGAGLASHAEIVSVPRNLCARVPEGVPAEDAAYATVAAIALHGVRLAEARLGDVVGVVGLGLVGQLTVELLAAAGCVVLGCDPDPDRADLARDAGVFATTDPRELATEARRLSAGRGADAVLVTAASRTAAPLATATTAARSRATVVIVGDVPIESPRAPLFGKELRVLVSRSYGPGRYDPLYEQRGIDYPADYVRWTQGRNLAEVLRLMSTGHIKPSRLTTHVFEVTDGAAAYQLLESAEPSLGILLRYGRSMDERRGDTARIPRAARRIRPIRRKRAQIGVIGAGTFARSVLLPHLSRHGDIAAVATATGVSARTSASRFGASIATTNAREILHDPNIDAIVIATRHGSHSHYVTEALASGKHVFVEKPLALNEDELREVESAIDASDRVLMVGFNRRFAPMATELKSSMGQRGPLVITYRVNAGRLPRGHWTHDPVDGGGRIVGEVCHFVDFAMFLTGCAPLDISAAAVGGGSEPRDDSMAATLRFPDGSVAVITYSALGDPGLPKEHVEVMGEAGAGVLDDFSQLTLYRSGQVDRETGHRDKGHRNELRTFLAACRTGRQPWPAEDMVAAMRTTFAIRDATMQPFASAR